MAGNGSLKRTWAILCDLGWHPLAQVLKALPADDDLKILHQRYGNDALLRPSDERLLPLAWSLSGFAHAPRLLRQMQERYQNLSPQGQGKLLHGLMVEGNAIAAAADGDPALYDSILDFVGRQALVLGKPHALPALHAMASTRVAFPLTTVTAAVLDHLRENMLALGPEEGGKLLAAVIRNAWHNPVADLYAGILRQWSSLNGHPLCVLAGHSPRRHESTLAAELPLLPDDGVARSAVLLAWCNAPARRIGAWTESRIALFRRELAKLPEPLAAPVRAALGDLSRWTFPTPELHAAFSETLLGRA